MIKRLWRWLEKFYDAYLSLRLSSLLSRNFQLLAEVNDEDWSHGRVKGFLDGKNIAEADLLQWLRRSGENLLASDGENRELATRMVRLGEVDCGELGEIASEIGRKLLGKCIEEETNKEKALLSKNGTSGKKGILKTPEIVSKLNANRL
ncbi:hypothetical protein [Calothrix sp. PCC 6303]|uniref:hypothetical protein n=1 Tax=Calothrix sp. PCC 6303 TaxID=1170562 RepID=UPI0002A01FF3|nr:hypothetical protein [Calothrix sp. PCC 6303]AFZ01380.1 protein prenyltransferase, alpha subunit [Calothrix sp. PCC 6303]